MYTSMVGARAGTDAREARPVRSMLREQRLLISSEKRDRHYRWCHVSWNLFHSGLNRAPSISARNQIKSGRTVAARNNRKVAAHGVGARQHKCLGRVRGWSASFQSTAIDIFGYAFLNLYGENLRWQECDLGLSY